MKVNIADQLAAGLETLGWVEIADRSKYRAFIHEGQNYKLFLGSKGGLRAGKNASDSMSMGDPSNQSSFYKKAMVAGHEALAAKQEVKYEMYKPALTKPQTINKMEK